MIIWLICLSLFFVLIIGIKIKERKWIESLAGFWFRIALIVFVLYMVHLWASPLGYQLPVNLFMILSIAILGIPGIICVFLIMVLS